MSPVVTDPEADHTVDPANVDEGQLVYLHGFEPAIVFGVEPDGKVEIGRFGSLEYVGAGDLSTHRGARPTAIGPEEDSPQDRIAALEAQVAALVDALKGSTVTPPPPAEEPPAPATLPAPSGPVSPFLPASSAPADAPDAGEHA